MKSTGGGSASFCQISLERERAIHVNFWIHSWCNYFYTTIFPWDNRKQFLGPVVDGHPKKFGAAPHEFHQRPCCKCDVIRKMWEVFLQNYMKVITRPLPTTACGWNSLLSWLLLFFSFHWMSKNNVQLSTKRTAAEFCTISKSLHHQQRFCFERS